MNEENRKLITETAYQFINEHFNEINLKHLDQYGVLPNDKNKCLGLILNDYDWAEWVVMELMSWGCDKDYLSELEVKDNISEDTVWKIGDKYFIWQITVKYLGSLKEVFPKTKTVIYFE